MRGGALTVLYESVAAIFLRTEMSDKKLIGSLTALRFFAALAIVVHHSRGVLLPESAFYGVPLASGVGFFFALSGFILAYVYLDSIENNSLSRFYASRFARIWPAHAASMLVLMVLLPSSKWIWNGTSDALVTLSNLSLIHSAIPIPAYYFSFNGPSWSLSTEAFFYVAFPFLIFSIWRTWHIKLVLVVFIGAAAVYPFDYFHVAYYSTERFTELSSHGMVYVNPLARIQEFYFGILTALVFLKIRGSRLFGFFSCTSLEVGAIAFAFCAIPYATTAPFARLGQSHTYFAEFISHIAVGAVFAVVILVFALNRGILSWLLSLRPFVILGQISFSLYLLHHIFLRFYQEHTQAFGFIPTSARFSVLLGISCLAAYVMWRWVEIPAQRYLKKSFERSPSASHIAAGAVFAAVVLVVVLNRGILSLQLRTPEPKQAVVESYASYIQVSDLVGEWKAGANVGKVEGSDGSNLIVTTETGLKGAGKVNGDRIEVASWRVTGKLTADKKKIRWSNTFVWTR